VDVLALEMLSQAEDLPEVMGAISWVDAPTFQAASGAGLSRLSARKTLVSGPRLLELERESEPGESPTEDRHVVAASRLLIIAHPARLSCWRVLVGVI
jgi:hypothetical protein